MGKSEIKAVFFDIDNTLYNFTEENREGMKRLQEYGEKELGIGRDQFHKGHSLAVKGIGERMGYDCAASHNRLIRYQTLLELLGKPIHPHSMRMYHLYWDTLLDTARPEPGAVRLMERLRELEVFVGIGTDMTAYIQYRKLERLGLIPFVDGIVTSEEAGIDKPGEQFFNLCLKKAGCRGRECLFIGDNPLRDIQGAEKAGMHPVCYTRYTEKTVPEGVFCLDSYERCLKGKQVVFGDIVISKV